MLDHGRVIESGVRITGCTVHFIRPELDEGPVIVQAATPVRPDDEHALEQNIPDDIRPLVPSRP